MLCIIKIIKKTFSLKFYAFHKQKFFFCTQLANNSKAYKLNTPQMDFDCTKVSSAFDDGGAI